ncbi:response regulator transcription factor, partial [Kineococcus indalonis]|uniref:response regulator transcription factor n=1 Tax=Kineococcus indalonis TaxID=2696566 RepID=UPI0014131A42
PAVRIPASRRPSIVPAAPAGADVSVLVCGVPPVSAHGIVAAVQQHGMRGERSRDLAELQERLALAPGTRVVLTALGAARATAHLLQRCTGGEVAMVVLLDDPAPSQHVAALRAGARGVAHAAAPLADLLAVLSAAARGFTVLPAAVAQALCLPLVTTRAVDVPAEERGWLRQLARGVSVAELAVRSSYSEREMYRLLNRAYQRLGAANRTEALLVAQRAGLLSA